MNEPEILFPISFSNSSLASAYSCEMKLFRSRIQWLNRDRETNGDLLSGGLFASAVEAARNDFYVQNLDMETILARADRFFLEAEDTGHAIKTNERLVSVFRHYLDRFPFESNFRPCSLENGKKAIEFPFSIDLGIQHPDFPDRNISYIGKLDGLYEKVVLGDVVKTFVVDEKTTGKLFRIPGTPGLIDLDKELTGFRLSGQMIDYAIAARLAGVKVQSALIRRVPILKDYEAAFELEVDISKHMRDARLDSVKGKIESLIDKYSFYKANKGRLQPSSVFFPSFNSSCNAYGRPCAYADGCISKDGQASLYQDYPQIINIENKQGERVNIPLAQFKLMVEKQEI